jgi:ribosomal subunit interface protein
MRIDITWHNLDASPAIAAEIREHVAKLERIYDRITTCRVAVEARHKQHRTGNVYAVHVELAVPRGELVVSREPHKAKERYASPDIHTSMRDAFRAVERQLKEYKEQLRGDEKLHERDTMLSGEVAQLDRDGEHGFILTRTGTQLYFAKTALMNGDFERLKRGDTVHYVERDGDTGPIAYKVWLASEQHAG